MTPEAYRIAYESALSDISEITAELERLCIRRSHVENLIAVFHEVFPSETADPVSGVTMTGPASGELASSRQGEEQGTYSYLDVPNPLPRSDGDPFQRRVKTSVRFKGLAAQRF